MTAIRRLICRVFDHKFEVFRIPQMSSFCYNYDLKCIRCDETIGSKGWRMYKGQKLIQKELGEGTIMSAYTTSPRPKMSQSASGKTRTI